MAFNFVLKKTATLTATLAGTTNQLKIPGCYSGETSADNAVAQVNKILAIGGKAIVADNKSKLTVEKGVEEV
ncbi:MAG: hypothetical protein SR1Q5_00890 [Quinella sp. 1Q5]|nr:hypothetical protein [Quinella sp. 1Q5]